MVGTPSIPKRFPAPQVAALGAVLLKLPPQPQAQHPAFHLRHGGEQPGLQEPLRRGRFDHPTIQRRHGHPHQGTQGQQLIGKRSIAPQAVSSGDHQLHHPPGPHLGHHLRQARPIIIPAALQLLNDPIAPGALEPCHLGRQAVALLLLRDAGVTEAHRLRCSGSGP